MTKILAIHDWKEFKQGKSEIGMPFPILLIVNDWQLYGKWIILLNKLKLRELSRRFVEKIAAGFLKVVLIFLIQPVSFVLLISLAARVIMKGIPWNRISLHVSTRSSFYAETP